MRRRHLWIVSAVLAVALTGYLLAMSPPDPEPPLASPGPAPKTTTRLPKTTQVASSPELPITQVVLYSNGVGYFQRDGQVEGNTHVDLSFAVQDVNDLLKSMVLQDLGGGQVSAVSYDSRDPLDMRLNSFAIRLADNPGYATILNQARGEQVQVTLAAKSPSPSPSQQGQEILQGTIVGVETKAPATKDGVPVEMLNLWCADGMRNLALVDVQCVKFLNPAVDSEVRRALEVLATSHDSQKKSVSLQFSGTGKRDVRVGYVVETPLWRTSYRLLVDKQGKVFAQGWAIVENPSSEDWKDVRMALVSARPISFKMDLYQPLYAPRPVVQNQIQAAIGPTAHGEKVTGSSGEFRNGQFGINGVGTEQAWATGGAASPRFGTETGGAASPRSPEMVGDMAPAAMPAAAPPPPLGANRAGPQINLQSGVIAAAKASDLGDSFQYAIEQPVTIPRQKSALLPIVNSGVEGEKVSLYSPQVHAKYPLLALRLKNTSGVHLMQGPVAVFEGTGYVGDAQMPDLPPGKQRLVSYAVDLGTEVEAKPGKWSTNLTKVGLCKGQLTSLIVERGSMTYSIANRSPHDRVVLVEHPRSGDHRLVGKDKPCEQTLEVYRFEKKVPAGETVRFEVVQEQDVDNSTPLTNVPLESVQWLLKCELSNPAFKSALEKLQQFQTTLQKMGEENFLLQQKLQTIRADQDRLRANLKEMPATSAVHKRYLEKFDKQETEIEKLQEQAQEVAARSQKQLEAMTTFANDLNVEATIRKAAPMPQAPATWVIPGRSMQ